MNPKVICVIMGGGRGTRLYPLTKVRSKPAVPLAGKYRLADIPISNCLNSGFNQIYLLTQFNTASLHRHVQQSYKFDPFGHGFVQILSAEQTEESQNWYQGTADAVRQNLANFGHYSPDDVFLILSGDQLYRMDLRKLVEHHLHHKADVTVTAKLCPRESASAFGLMRVDDEGYIHEFVEKPQDPAVIDNFVVGGHLTGNAEGQCLVSMGIYAFRAGALAKALSSPGHDFGKEIIPGLLGQQRLSSFIFDGYWEDIGTVRSFFDANLRLTETVPPFNFFDPEKPIFTHSRYLPASKFNGGHFHKVLTTEGCITEEGVHIEESILGVRSFVGAHTRMRRVIMMGSDHFETDSELTQDRAQGIPPIGVGPNCHLENVILDRNVRIGRNVRINPEGKTECYISGDVLIRDGLAIVTKGGIIPDDTVI